MKKKGCLFLISLILCGVVSISKAQNSTKIINKKSIVKVAPEKATTTTKLISVINEPVGIIKNGSFIDNMNLWNMLKVGSGQIMNLLIVNDSDKYPYVLDINRQGADKKKGLLGLSQSLNIDVATHTLITLSADVKVLSATLDSDGKKGGVYPVTMEITYSDKTGQEHSWRHGFFAGKRLNYPEIGELIVENKWFAYKSLNLAMLKPRPAVITCVKVYGEGWGFHGRVANLMLVSEKAPNIVISEEEVLTINPQSTVHSPQLTEKATATMKSAPMIKEKPLAVASEKATVTTKPVAIVSEKATVTTKPVAVSRQEVVGGQQLIEEATITVKPAAVVSEEATVTTQSAVIVPEKATVTIKPVAVVPEEATVTTKPVIEKATITTKLAVIVSEKATVTTKSVAVSRQLIEETTVTVKPAEVVPEEATVTTKPEVVVLEKATVTTKPSVVVLEKATTTTKPVVVVSEPEEGTTTIKPATIVSEKTMTMAVVEKPMEPSKPVATGQITPEEMKEILEQVALPETGTPSSGVIKNSSFSTGLKHWQLMKNGEGELNLKIVKESIEYPFVLEINRIGGGKTKGRIGVFQDVNLPVADNKLITVSANIKVISATLDSDGTKGGVYPITIEMEYSDKAGKTHSWRHGFLAGKRLNYAGIGELIAGNEWIAYKSLNLAMLKPRPVVITCVKVYGEGWGFHGRVANLILVSEKAEETVVVDEIKSSAIGSKMPVNEGTITLVGTTTMNPTTVVSEKATVTTKPAAVSQQLMEEATATMKPAEDSGRLSEKATATTVVAPVIEKKLAAITVEQPAVVSQQLTEKATITMKPTVDSEQLSKKATTTTGVAPEAKEKPIAPVAKTPATEKTPETLIKNGDFTNELNSWEKIQEGEGITKVEIINDSIDYPFVLEINRKESAGQKGFLGLKQKIDERVDDYTLLAVVMDLKIISSSLESDGTEGGQYPMCIEVLYEDNAGIFHTWKQGFLYAENINYPKIVTRVPKDKWYIYLSGNLLKLEPKPKILKEIKIYGHGNDFVARITNLNLIGGKMRIPREEN